MKKCRERCLTDSTSQQYEKANRITVCRYNPAHHIYSWWIRDHYKSCPDSIPNATNCIYNFYHIVRNDRLAKHLWRYRRYYLYHNTQSPYHERAKEISVCVYNSNHHEFFLEQHYKTCPDVK